MSSFHKFMKPRGAIFATMCTLVLALPLFADPVQIVPGDYAKSFVIKFPGYTGLTTLTDFPVLIRLSLARNAFDYSKCKVDNGGDLRFADSDGNLLSSEVDTWNENGESLVWVKVPSLNSSTMITAYYGYKGDGNPPAVTASDVWSNGYVGVWHMDETTRSQSDSTSSGKTMDGHATYTANMAYGVEGVVGKGVEQATPLDAEGKCRGGFQASDPGGLYNDTKTLTVEMWGCQREASNDKYIVRDKTGSTIYAARWTWSATKSPTETKLYYTVALTNLAAGTGNEYTKINYSVQTNDVLGTWRHYALVIDNETLHRIEAYYDGTSKATQDIQDAGEALVAGSGTLAFGNSANNNAQTYPGTIDELRVSRVARSADWVKATYDTVSNDEFVFYRTPTDWTKYSHKFSVSFPGATNGVLSAFPVLVKVSEYDETTGTGIKGFSYADCLKEKGGDLRFSDADGNLLDSEVDTWDADGESLIWVNVPTLSSGTKITAYYGWQFAPKVDSLNVWSNGYVGVWHLGETALPLKDSTASPADFVSENSSVTYGQAGVVGGSPRFLVNDNTNCFVKTKSADSGKLNGGAAITIEAWTCQYWHKESPEKGGYILAKDSGSANWSYRFYDDNNAGSSSYRCLDLNFDGVKSKTPKSSAGLVPFSADEDIWNYQVFSYDSASEASNKASYYLNGILNITSDVGSTPITNSVSHLYLGNAHNYNKYGHAFPGKIDEVRISNVARSAGWLATTYDMIKGNAAFATYSSASELTKGLMLIVR